MRTYSNYLLFEGVLDSLSSSSDIVGTMAKSVVTPVVKIVEEDCGTTLGTEVVVNFDLEGDILLSTNTPLTYSHIYSLLSSGVYKVGVRKASSCISKGGVCRKCAAGSMLGATIPAIGEGFQLVPEFNYKTEYFVGDGIRKSYLLRTDYDVAKVIINGLVVKVLSGETHVDFTVAPAPGQKFIIRYYTADSSSLLGYIARSFSGGLLGVRPLDTPPLVIREELYNSILQEGQIAILEEEVLAISGIDSKYMDYVAKVHSKLEKCLMLLFTYAIFSDIIYQ